MSKKNRHSPADKKINAETANLPLTPKPSLFHLIFLSLVLILSVVIVYRPSLKVPFLLDDYGKITRNPDIKSLSNIPSRLIYPYSSEFEFHRNDPSRPLTYLTLTLNYHFGQLNPYGYHVVNIGLHIIVVLLVFILALHLLPIIGINGLVIPFLSALLFAVHPISVNGVTYIMGGRPSSLASIFYLLAVILFIQAQRRKGWRIPVSAACFGFALASNQLAITLPAIIFLTDFCFFKEKSIRNVLQNWKQHIVYWGVLVFYLGLRIAYFGQLGDVEASAQFYGHLEYFQTELVVVWKYLGFVFWPSRLSFEHLFGPLKQIADLKVLGALSLYGVLIFGIVKQLKSSIGALLVFGFLWFLITLSPTSSFLPTTATMAENRLYLPLAGFSLIIPVALGGFLKKIFSTDSKPISLVLIFSVLAFGLGGVTYRRNELYQDPIALWTDVTMKYPKHARAYKNLGVEYMKVEQFELAVKAFQKTLELNPKDYDASNNLAATYYNLGRYKDALATYRDIVSREPNHAAAFSNMGMVYEKLNDTESAIKAYQNALQLNPASMETLNNLGAVYLERGRFKEAAALFEEALRIDPNNPQILGNYQKVKHRR